MEGESTSSKPLWGLALGGQDPTAVTQHPVERPYHVTKAVLSEPLRLQTRDEYASLYIDTQDASVEVLRFVLEDAGVEKPLDLTFHAGDKVTYRVLGFPSPCVHLIGHYLDKGAGPRQNAPRTNLERLLADWNNMTIFKLVEREMQRDSREKDDDEKYNKVMETIKDLERNVEAKLNADQTKLVEVVSEVRTEVRLLREGLFSLVEVVKSDVAQLRKEVNAGDFARRLDALTKEMKNAQAQYDESTTKLKEDIQHELDQVKKELKKTIDSATDFEEEFDDLKRLLIKGNLPRI